MSENVADFGLPEPVDQREDFGEPESAPTHAPVPAPAPVSLTAYRAVRGPAPDAAAQAISLAKDRRISPQFVADNLAPVQQADEQQKLVQALAGAPVTAEYMAQSAPHAALAREDVGVLEALERGLSDVGYAELSTVQMSLGSDRLEEALQADEEQAAAFEKKHSGVVASLVRQTPMLGAFFLADKLGMGLGGKAGGAAAVGGLMYALNRGSLYRQIMSQYRLPFTDQELKQAEAGSGLDFDAYEKRARAYATVGAGVSAGIGAGLSSVTSYALGGATAKIRSLSNGLIARAFTDEATRDVVARLVDAGGHTLWGALMMAAPAVSDDATVQKATSGEIDWGKAFEHGWDALKSNLLASGVLATVPHVVPLMKDVGRIGRAPVEAAQLDHMVEQANAATMTTRAPQEAEALIGKMADQGTAQTVYVAPEAAADPQVTQKLVEALADEGRAVAEAQTTQSDVPVPIEKYLVQLRDLHDQVRDDVKLSPDGLTPREASLLADQLHKEMFPPDSFKKADETTPTEEQPRLQDAMAARYGGTPEDWERALTPETVKRLQAAISPQEAVAQQPPPLTDHAAWAEKLVDETPIGELQPGRYELAARRAEDKLAKIATQAAGKGTEAAGQAFVGAGMRDIGKEQTPKAGQENLREAGKKAVKAQKLLDTVPMLERARDAARAEAKAHAGAVDEMQKARDYIAKRDTDRARADLGKASPEYLDLFNVITGAIDENTPQVAKDVRPLAVDQLLLRMANDAEPVGFDADKLRDILGDAKSWQKLTPPEARVVLDAVKNIRSAARRQNELTLSERKVALRDFVTGVREYLDERQTPDRGLPAPSRASQTTGGGLAEGAGKLHTELLQARELLRRLGPGGEAIYDAFVRSRNAKEDLARQVGDLVWKMYEQDLPKDLKKTRFDGVKGPGSPVFKDNLWTRQDLWEFASWWGSESGQDRIRRGLGITNEQAHAFMSQLTNAEADFLEAKWKLNDEKLWPLIRDHAREVTGVAPPKVEASPFTIRTAEGDIRELRGGYEPARYRNDMESTAKAPEQAESIADYWGSLNDSMPGAARYFLKERVETVKRTPDLNWSMYAGHVNSVLHYLAYDDFVRNAGRVFRDKEFRELVQRRLSPQAMVELDKFLGVAARGRIDATMDGASTWSRMIGWGFRSRVATAAFQMNPRILLGQLSHLPAAAAALKLGPQDMLYGLAQAARPSTWGAAFDASKQLSYRWDGFSRKMQEQLGNIGPGAKPSSREWLDAAGWSAYHAMDGFLSKAIYEAAASKAERAGLAPDQVVKAADDAVATMMPPMNLAEQSSFARDRGVIGSLLLVRNFPNTLYNVGARLEWEARNQVWASDPGWQKAKVALGAYGAAAASYLGTVWAAHILGRFLMGHGKEHDETTSQWLEREAISAPFYPVPLVGDVVSTVAKAAVTKKKLSQIAGSSLMSAPAVHELELALADLGKVVGAPRTEDRIFAGLRLSANALRLPSEPLRGVQYGYDIATGRFRPRGPFDVAGGFTYGKRRRQPKNPATVAQDFLSGE
jgi:hypothetical protein